MLRVFRVARRGQRSESIYARAPPLSPLRHAAVVAAVVSVQNQMDQNKHWSSCVQRDAPRQDSCYHCARAGYDARAPVVAFRGAPVALTSTVL
jgi:hypothetical protein